VFDFIFKFIFDLDWLRRWWSVPIDFVAMPRRKTIDVKHGVLAHGWREEESVGEITSALCDFVGAKLSRS
jgi:hypothetical protein